MERIRFSFWMLLACLSLATPALCQTTPTTYLVTGRCSDYGTALGLKARIYATIDGMQKDLGKCRDVGKFEPLTGIFDVRVPITATQLELVMPGYRTVRIPIQFAPNIPAHARFSIYNWSEMTSLDSLPKPADKEANLALFFDMTDSLHVDAELRSTQDPKWVANFPAHPRHPNFSSFTLPFPTPPGEYVLTTRTQTGQRISVDTFQVVRGLTFKSVRVVKPTSVGLAKTAAAMTTLPQTTPPTTALSTSSQIAAQDVGSSKNSPIVTPPSSTTLYFDQSSHDLRDRTRHTLDSVAQLLSSNPALHVTLTGYSDNTGPQGPNLILSEYRARTVANYLQQQRVPASRITAKWVGPAPGTSLADADSVKSRSRRVEVQLAPR